MKPLVRATLAGGVLCLGLALALTTSAPSCQTYVPPPTATIDGLSNGILQKPTAPIVVTFSTPVDPSTVHIVIAPFDIDAYGNLPDEVPDAGSLDALVTIAPTSDTHATSTLSADQTTLTIDVSPTGWLPTGPSLVLLVSPGLTSETTGTVLHYRERIPFAYPTLAARSAPTRLGSGAYFFVMQVTKPLPLTLKAFAAIDVDGETGDFVGQFTAALRNSDPNRCSPPCVDGNVCKELPTPSCVLMSTPPDNAEEYPDYVWKATSPNGYTFEMHGHASNVGDAGAVNILTQPGELTVPSPAVTAKGLVLTAEFVPVDGGVVQASGALTATELVLGATNLGAGSGTLSAVSIPDAQAPDGLPEPGTENSDAGVDGDAGGEDGATDGG
jgi:hypothetical protein